MLSDLGGPDTGTGFNTQLILLFEPPPATQHRQFKGGFKPVALGPRTWLQGALAQSLFRSFSLLDPH